MMVTMDQNTVCESWFFIWILSTDEPKDFRRTVTISVFQFRCGSFNLKFFEISGSQGLTDQPVKLHGLLLARTRVGGNVSQSLLQRIIVLYALPLCVVVFLLNHPAIGGNVLAEAILTPTFNPLHCEINGGEGSDANDVVVVLHAPIITEPQAFSSLGSDFFQIFSEVRK